MNILKYFKILFINVMKIFLIFIIA